MSAAGITSSSVSSGITAKPVPSKKTLRAALEPLVAWYRKHATPPEQIALTAEQLARARAMADEHEGGFRVDDAGEVFFDEFKLYAVTQRD